MKLQPGNEDIVDFFANMTDEAFVDHGVEIFRSVGSNGRIANPEADDMVAGALTYALEGISVAEYQNLPNHHAKLAIGALRECLHGRESLAFSDSLTQSAWATTYLQELCGRFDAAQIIE